jgi:hypothetical protein
MKKGVTDRYIYVTRGFVVLLSIWSVAMVSYAVTLPGGMFKSLMLIFGVVGGLQVRNLFKSKAVIRSQFSWLVEHIRGMMISGIAAHTAFAAFGGRRLLSGILSDSMMILPWVLPTVIGVIIIKVMKRRYARPRHVTGLAAVVCIALSIPAAQAQLYTEQQTRHRFAEMTIGLDLQQHLGMESNYLQNGQVQSLDVDGSIIPRILIGGTHFWGHADFFVAFPLRGPSFDRGEQSVSILSGVETGFKYYPWRITHGKVRPYVGFTLTDYYYRHTNDLLADPLGAEQSRVLLPLVAGFNYRRGPHMLEAGISYNYAGSQDYYLSADVASTGSLPRLWGNVSYKFAFDTTISAERSWEDGTAQEAAKILGDRGDLDDFFVGVGLSSVWWLRSSEYVETVTPYLGRSLVNVMPDFSAGYYWHKTDMDVGLSWRSYSQGMRAYDAAEQYGRKSLAIEAKKYLGDYHGFVPFAGPVLSHEWLDYSHSVGSSTTSVQDQQLGMGLVFGWDIRPNRLQWFVLRTNLRYFPRLRVDTPDGLQARFDNIEFNFIQFVFYPGRL